MVPIPEVYWRACSLYVWFVGVDPLHVLFLAEFSGSEVGTWSPYWWPFLVKKEFVKETFKYMCMVGGSGVYI